MPTSDASALSAEKIDPELLKNLDLIEDMDVIEQAADWETVEELESIEKEDAESAQEGV
jgi:hypothetical protein